MGLDEYWRKRDFARTPEPAGDARTRRARARAGGRHTRATIYSKTGASLPPELAGERGATHAIPEGEPAPEPAAEPTRSFVIQKHAARRLHYDFRLELDGVLLSWAVPKGPSYDPQEKRLAVHVEDHPLEYAEFEGIIPQGEYGGGTVMIWDRGTWIPEGDPRDSYRRGRLSFRLDGEKLHGRWSLVRSGGRAAARNAAETGEKEQWLLLKRTDEAARPLAEGDVLEEAPDSAATGRSMDAIAAAKDRVWRSNRGAEAESAPAPGHAPKAASRTRTPPVRPTTPAPRGPLDLAAVPGARRAALPAEVAPELATLVDAPPAGPGWIYEIKYDGYRALALADRGAVRFLSRSGRDWTASVPHLQTAVAALPFERAIVDGELVVLTPRGTSSFQLLQNALGAGRDDDILYYVFDLLYLDGWDLRDAPLRERKRLLAGLFAGLPKAHPVRYGDHVEAEAPRVLEAACALGAEGIVAKDLGSRYLAKRTRDWLKVKCTREQELVIGGFTDPAGARTGIGALLVGVHTADGALVYAGKVGTGFDRRTLEDLDRRLAPLERKTSPFADRLPRRRGVHWVAPKLVAAVAFTEWTNDGLLRHPSFRGLRLDKDARDVVREEPAPVEEEPPPTAPAPTTTRARGAARGPTRLLDVRLTNPARVLYPEIGLTKRELADLYLGLAELMLPHVAHRPLMIRRCPEGHSSCFYQKHESLGMPDVLHVIPIDEESGRKPNLWIDSAEGLVAIAQLAGLEVHTWGSRVEDVERPDRLVFDLDPDPTVPWPKVVHAAVELRALLTDLGLESFVKTTGGKGLHVVVPVAPTHAWPEVKDFTRDVAELMVRRAPTAYVATMTKAKRREKIFIDHFRNGRGATAVAPYSPRARPGAPIAMPLHWDELLVLRSPDAFTARNALEHVHARNGDPWAEISQRARDLAPARSNLRTLEDRAISRAR